MRKGVITGPMVTIVTRTVVVTVVMIFPVTKCLVSVTGDVIRDTQTRTVAKNVNPIILDWIAKNVVLVIAKTVKLVTMSVEDVRMDVRMGLWTNIVIALVKPDGMGKTVLMSVLKVVMGHVTLQMDHATIVKVQKVIAPKCQLVHLTSRQKIYLSLLEG